MVEQASLAIVAEKIIVLIILSLLNSVTVSRQ